jgi:hypothetical protein
MTVSAWTEADSNRAQEIWSEYRQHHDVSAKVGQTAGIDPVSGHIRFGNSIQDVIAQRDADGSAAPLFFLRLGWETYYRKGGRAVLPLANHGGSNPPCEKGLQRKMRQAPLQAPRSGPYLWTA